MKNIFVIIIVLCSFSAVAQSNLKGIWHTGKENTLIEISQSNGQWTGQIKSSDNEKAQIGKVTLKALKKDGSKWTGKIYAAKRKEWYDVEITPNNDILKLEIDVGLLNKSLEWRKQL